MNKYSTIYIAGHKGMVGSAIHSNLIDNGFKNIITKRHDSLDLTDQFSVQRFFREYQPEYVFLCAAKVGGIKANSTYPVDFMYENMMIEMNVIKNAYDYNCKKLLMLGSSCIYPKVCEQPIKEEALLSGYLESTNECYALAKIAGIKLCQAYNKQYGKNFISVMPSSIFGIGDNFHPENAHLIPALMGRIHDAKMENIRQVEVWGTGKPLREFMFADDFAEATIFLMKNYKSSEIINVGTGCDISIYDIAHMIKDTVGYAGELVFNHDKPDGTMKKCLDTTKMDNLGWKAKTSLSDGLQIMYDWYLNCRYGG